MIKYIMTSKITELIQSVENDTELSDKAKKSLKALIDGDNDDENLKDLACYMRGDDKKYGKLHRNSKFTKSIIKHVRKLREYLLFQNETASTDRANKLYYWLWKHMGKPIRYKNVSSEKCGDKANKNSLKISLKI